MKVGNRCWMKVGNLCCDQKRDLSDWSTGGMLSQLRVAVVAAVVTSTASQITVAGTSSRNGAVIDALWNRPLNVSHEFTFFDSSKRIHSIQNPPHTCTHPLRLPQPLVSPRRYRGLWTAPSQSLAWAVVRPVSQCGESSPRPCSLKNPASRGDDLQECKR
jgi:hypothetical protein